MKVLTNTNKYQHFGVQNEPLWMGHTLMDGKEKAGALHPLQRKKVAKSDTLKGGKKVLIHFYTCITPRNKRTNQTKIAQPANTPKPIIIAIHPKIPSSMKLSPYSLIITRPPHHHYHELRFALVGKITAIVNIVAYLLYFSDTE